MLRDPHQIPGWFLPIEADAVVHAALAAAGKKGRLVELGTWCGRSAAFFADALPEWEINTIDPYPPHVVAIWGRDLQAHPRVIAEGNFADRPNVRQHIKDSIEAANYWPLSELIDVLFVDGEHIEERVRRELSTWLPFMAPGGIVLLHDATGKPDFSPAIQRAADAMLPKAPAAGAPWGHAPDFEAGSLWAFRRAL